MAPFNCFCTFSQKYQQTLVIYILCNAKATTADPHSVYVNMLCLFSCNHAFSFLASEKLFFRTIHYFGASTLISTQGNLGLSKIYQASTSESLAKASNSIFQT